MARNSSGRVEHSRRGYDSTGLSSVMSAAVSVVGLGCSRLHFHYQFGIKSAVLPIILLFRISENVL
jgi:hypothetical protein